MTQPVRRLRLPLDRASKMLLAAGAAVVFALGLYFGIEVAKPPPRPDFGLTPPAAEARDDAPPVPPTAVVAPLTLERQPPPTAGGRPRVSIVIDDLGRSLRELDTLANLGIPLTYAVLPFASHTPQVVAELVRRGEEFLCHLPMEAKGGANPGPGALYLTMSRDELIAATRRAIEAVPGAVGVNNHMGSGMAAQRQAMTAVLSVLADRRLFFLDSRTSADTVGYTLARQLGVPAGERQVFLDTERDPAFIRTQFERLLALARERGAATAIAHPYPETLELLAASIPAAEAAGFEFVRASSLLEG